jgi:hypothetical protein
MGGLLGELGKKLADRWLTLLVLPGALYLATAAAARILGQAHALDLDRITARLTLWIKAPAATTAGGQIVLLATILAAAGAAGLAAQALGSAVESLILAAGWRTWPWPLRPLAAQWTTARRNRWNTAHAHYHRLRDQAEQTRRAGARPAPVDRDRRNAAYRAWTRISLEQPDRPTWSADRVHAVAIRLDRDLHLDLATLWPYLWVTMPDAARADINAARQSLTRATTLAGWAPLYLALAFWWWPAAPAAVIIAVTARQRTRAATDTYARFLDATVRLHITGLAHHLSISHAGPPTPDLGDTLTHHFQTQPAPADPTPAPHTPPPQTPEPTAQLPPQNIPSAP